ncbi:hypothetical protein [Blastomonas fulva]|uniref:hypothetical protein n=1 Tax=Blastomonas fulva TaxID=1550728 RepID=UPI003D2AFBE2
MNRSAAMARKVNRVLGLVLGVLLMISMGMGAAAHASETMCLPDIEASGANLDHHGDADPSGDTGDGVLHQHGGCHGHHVAAPIDDILSINSVPSDNRLSGSKLTMAPLAQPDAALRPPNT